MIAAHTTLEHRRAVLDLMAQLIAKAEGIWSELAQEHWLTSLKVDFELTGRSAGRAKLQENRVQFNDWLLERNVDAFLQETVAHELAHIIHHCLWPHDRAWHGRRWQLVMRTLGYEPERCHNLSTEGMPGLRRQRRWVYKCNCREHALTTVRHNKIRRIGRSYTCKLCGTILTFTGEQA